MKKIFFIGLFSIATIAVTPGCSGSQNSTASTVTNSVIAVLAGILQTIGGASSTASVTAQTKLNDVLTTAAQVTEFKNLLSSTYQLSKPAVDQAYSGFNTLKSVVDYVVANAQQSMLPKS